jgi:eukaryotic-like serine/threonine-protein kinase
MSDYVGQQFGNYRLVQVLSVRSDAVLYLAEHLHLATQATLKLYNSRLLQNDQQSFLTEAEALAHLVHPHIVRILEGGIAYDVPFLVMASTTGLTLRQQYRVNTMLSLPTIISFVKQIALALDYAHSIQVLHLDVRSDNIWFGHNNNVLLSNFRMKLFSHNSRSESMQEVLTTASYMAPEQMQGRAVPASDQYMLGIMVYEWLCGSLPFLGTDYVEVARQHLDAPPPSLCDRVPGLPASLEQVVMKTLAKESTQRFPSIQAFADALEQSYLAPWDVANPPAVFTAGTLEKATPSTAIKNSLTRRRITLGLAGLAGTATLATAGGMVWFSRQPFLTKPDKPEIVPTPVGTTLSTYHGHTDIVYGVSWSRDGKSIASWSRDDTMQVWHATTLVRISTDSMGMIVAWSPDWRFVAACSNDNVLQVWERSTGRIFVEHAIPLHGSMGFGLEPVKKFVQWSSDGKYLASSLGSFDGDSTQVWDMSTGKILFSKPQNAIAWSPDGKYLALRAVLPLELPPASRTNTPVTVQIWDVAIQALRMSYMVPGNADTSASSLPDGSLLWSPDGKYMASGSGNIWNATTGKTIATYQSSRSWSMVWSPNSRYIAAFDDSQHMLQDYNQQYNVKADPTVHVWNVLTGEDVFVYREHTAGVNDVAWSPDSTKIASASADMTVKVWQAVAM